MSWLAGLLEIIGGILVGNKKKIGFIANFLCCIVWIHVGTKNIYNPEIGGILSVVIPMLFINVRNFFKWLKEEKCKD